MKLQLIRVSYGLLKLVWLILILGSVVILFYTLPASWVSGLLADQTACRVGLVKPSGSIWQGSAALGFSEQSLGGKDGEGCQGPTAITERFAWQMHCELKTFQCLTTITYPALEKPVQITWRSSGAVIRANQVSLPANLLEAMGNPWKTLRPRGQLLARWTDIQIGDAASGIIRIMISNMASPISAVTPLGSYEIAGSISPKASQWVLETTSGPLLLKGKGQWGAQGLQFNGEASSAPEVGEALQGLLALLGRKEGGVYRLQF